MAYGDLNQYRLGGNVQRLPNPPQLQQPYSLSQRVTQPPRPIMPLPQSNYNTQFVNARPAQTPNPQNPLQSAMQSLRDFVSSRASGAGRQYFQGRQEQELEQQRQAFEQRPVGLNQPGGYAPPTPRQTSFSNADVRPGSFTTDAQARAGNPSLFGPNVRRDEFGNSLALADRFNREADTLQQRRQDQIAARDLGIDRNIATAREQRAQQDIDRLVGIGGERLAQGRLDPAALAEPTSRLQAAQQSLSGLAAQDTARRAIPGQQAQQQFENQIQSLGAQAQLQEAQAAGLAAQADLLGAQPDPGAQRTEIIQSLVDNPTLVAPEGMSQGEYIRSLADEILSSGGINQQDISTLRNDPSPEAIAEFNSLYGPGAAQRYLNG